MAARSLVVLLTKVAGPSILWLALSEAQAMPDELYKAGRSQIYVGGALLDYASKGNTVELIGKEDNNYKIKVTSQHMAYPFLRGSTDILNIYRIFTEITIY